MDCTYRGRHGEAIHRFKDGMLPSDFFRRNVVLSFQEDAIGIRQPPSNWRFSFLGSESQAMELLMRRKYGVRLFSAGQASVPRTADSPRQPNGRVNSHLLFLGLSTYVFACRARCHSRAVVAVRQN